MRATNADQLWQNQFDVHDDPGMSQQNLLLQQNHSALMLADPLLQQQPVVLPLPDSLLEQYLVVLPLPDPLLPNRQVSGQRYKSLLTLLFTLIFIGSLLLSITSCRNKNGVPSDVISQPKMEKVLWDMVVADRFAMQFVVKDSAKKDVTQETFRLYSEVFSMNGVTKDEFIKSYKFYMTRPDLTKVMFDSIMQRSNRLKEESYRPKLTTPLDTTAAGLRTKDSLARKDSTARRDSIARKDSIAVKTTIPSQK